MIWAKPWTKWLESSFEEYGVSFGEAYKKEKNTDRWKDIRVILVGAARSSTVFAASSGSTPGGGSDATSICLFLGVPRRLDSPRRRLEPWELHRYRHLMPTLFFCCLPLDCRIPQKRYRSHAPGGHRSVATRAPRADGLYDYEAPDD